MAASTILLMADLPRRAAGGRRLPRLALVQHANTPVLDQGIDGFLAGLAERGLEDGRDLVIERMNAQGDMPTGVAIARQVTGGGFDLVVTSSTPSLQAVANSNREGTTRHVFFLVADPFRAGVGLDRADPLRHPPHLVGQGLMAPVDEAFRLVKACLPSVRAIGMAWNPAESNSLAFATVARDLARTMGLTLVEAGVDSTSAVVDAVNSLIARGAQAVWVGGDNTVSAALETVIATARRAGVPVFTILPGRPDRGTLLDVGPDFFEAGRQAAFLAADVLRGADMRAIPIRNVSDVVPSYLSVNTTVLKDLEDPWSVPDAVRSRASVLVDETGVHEVPKARAARRGGRGQ